MVEVPGGNHSTTCTRLTLLDGSHIFLRTKWFNTSFSVTAMVFPRSWSCDVATQEVEDIASMLGINCEEFFSQARVYLGDGVSDSQYSFEALCRRPNVMRLSWTTADMRYNEEPRVALFLQEDNSTTELVPEFLNVLLDTTLILKDLLARRKFNKSKKVRQLAMRFSATEKVRKRSLTQQSLTREEMRVGLDGLVVKSEFPNSTPKFNSSTVSYEPASGLSTPTHPPSLTALDGRVQQHELRTPAMENLISVSSTSKSLNLGVHNAGRLVSEEETVPCYGLQTSSFCFDRPNGSGNYLGVSHGQLKSLPLPPGYQGIGENKREQGRADGRRLRALEQQGEAFQVPMTDDLDYISDRVGSSQLQLPMKVDVYAGLDRVPAPKHSPEFPARLYEHGLPSWSQPRTPIGSTTVDIDSVSRPAPTFHDVAVPQNVQKIPTGDKAVLSHESRKLGVASSGASGWINPRKSSTGVESGNFGLSASERHNASEGVIMLSDSEEEDYQNLEVDPGVLDDEDLLDRRIPSAMEDLPDEPENEFTTGACRLNESIPVSCRGNNGVSNMNVSKVKDGRSRSRLESEAQASLGLRSRSRKRKAWNDAHEGRTDVFDDGKRMPGNEFIPKEEVLAFRGSLSRNGIGLDSQVSWSAGAAPSIKAESEYQREQNAVWQSGEYPYGTHPGTFVYGSRAQWKPAYHTADNHTEKFASSFNYENRAQWNTWISEAKTEVTSWEAQIQLGNPSAGGSGCVGNEPTESLMITSSPGDSKHLVSPVSLKKLNRNLDVVDFPHTNSEHLLSKKESLNVNLFPSEENSGREHPEVLDRGCDDNPERSHTRDLDKSKKGVSSDVPELEKVKVEREFVVEAGNDGDSDSVEEHVFEPGFDPGLHDDPEGMISAGESVADVLKIRQSEKIRPLNGRKLPGRRGRPPGTKTQSHVDPTKTVSQGAKGGTDGTSQSDKDPKNTNLQRVSRTSRPVGRPKHNNSQGHPTADVDKEQQRPVPDSDYYCFDGDRVKEKIKPNEVWALYHGIDTMPRYLIRVKEVSVNGAFWVKASWLQPHTASKKNERQKETLYPRSCGDFEELKETTIFNVVNYFSHRMEFTPKRDFVIQVYPRKGEVWALHKKENLKQSRSEKVKQGEGNDENGNFRLVVILSNCGEGRPVDILVLRKRTGYRTLWEPGYKRGSLPIGNMERFSHRVPAYKLTEEDYPDLNNSDIWDIDAAAVPECQSKVT